MESKNNKYFTPNIEDIRVGYELESHEWSMDELGIPELNYDRWVKKVLDKNNIQIILKYGLKGVRVHYLTKEQIEAEGWIETTSHGMFRKGDYLLGLLSPMITIRYRSWYPEETKFVGQCKDINTFRYICKLLNI